MEVAVWPKAFGLPSFDSKCLSVMSFCKFMDIPVRFVETGNPWRSPTGLLPVLKDGKNKVTGIDEICEFLEHNSSKNIVTNKNNAVSKAIIALMEEKLAVALEHYLWVDSKNFTEFSRPLYAKSTIFPLSLYWPITQNKHIINRLSCSKGNKFITEQDMEYKVYKNAKECINHLSSILGENNFFFGNNPTYLDAVVFGYLAPIFKSPIPNQSLKNHLIACTNLTNFCKRILDRFFPLTPKEIEELTKSEEKRAQEKRNTDIDFPNKTRNSILAGVFAVSAMILYAFASGMVSFESSDEDEDEGVDYDYKT